MNILCTRRVGTSTATWVTPASWLPYTEIASLLNGGDDDRKLILEDGNRTWTYEWTDEPVTPGMGFEQ